VNVVNFTLMTWIPLAILQVTSLLLAISYLDQPGETYRHDVRQVVFIVVGYLAIPLMIYLFINFFYRLGNDHGLQSMYRTLLGQT